MFPPPHTRARTCLIRTQNEKQLVEKHAAAFAAKKRSLDLARYAECAEARGSPTTRYAAAVLREKQNLAAAKVSKKNKALYSRVFL